MSGGSGAPPQTDDIDTLLAIFTIDTLRDLKKHCRAATIGEKRASKFHHVV
jgi:hypothetical protein